MSDVGKIYHRKHDRQRQQIYYGNNCMRDRYQIRNVNCSICGKPKENPAFKLCKSCAAFIRSMKNSVEGNYEKERRSN